MLLDSSPAGRPPSQSFSCKRTETRYDVNDLNKFPLKTMTFVTCGRAVTRSGGWRGFISTPQWRHMSVMAYQHTGNSYYSFNNLFRLTTKKTQLRITGLMWDNPIFIDGLLYQRTNDAKGVSWHHEGKAKESFFDPLCCFMINHIPYIHKRSIIESEWRMNASVN